MSSSQEKTLMLGKIEGRKRRGRQRTDGWMASLTQWTWVWASSKRWWRTGKFCMLQSMGLQGVRHNWVTRQQQQQWVSKVINKIEFQLYWTLKTNMCSRKQIVLQLSLTVQKKIIFAQIPYNFLFFLCSSWPKKCLSECASTLFYLISFATQLFWLHQ